MYFKINKIIPIAILLVVLCIAKADYHAFKGKEGNINHLIIAQNFSMAQEHKSQLVSAIFKRMAKTNRKYHKSIIRNSIIVSRNGVMKHPKDPLSWQSYANCLIADGKMFWAYSALSRSVMLDPTFEETRGLHFFLARKLNDRHGAISDFKVLKGIENAKKRRFEL